MFEVRDVTKRFGGLTAVSDASLMVDSGEIVGVIGPNGAGKSTLFSVIAGVLRPDEGVVLDGEKVLTGLRPYRMARAGVARTFQTPRPFGALTVRENMVAAAHTVHRSTADAHAWAAECLERIGLTELAEVAASTLPLGMRKRLEVGRALATKPRLLLLDEVLGGLNPNEIDTMVALIRELRQSGMAICMVEHAMAIIMSLCDRIYVIDHGVVISTGTPQEVSSDQQVIDAYLGGSV
ncbi:branched-chain amino acid ABC transporter ATP-binding protein [Intrasporangium chromatireducens Q5-1]|uniref:Branched-chain amino acid ABC transporter ATP-binding protein n=1 Tax=Intrasporangium chromatireducens Q5-1 TaxID=584657 RepID=W9GJJ0_9MICO|nr:ABC transporter ATP-binding protein [Intrasporangium chromatireducens]EWT06265.1 branched-chain amino acid ABC transporter ATP-binding protein [Intrasporangium chromatireducens Q5-1]